MPLRWTGVVSLLVVPLVHAAPGDIDLVTVDYTPQAQGAYTYSAGLSADGRYALFQSEAPSFVPGDTNGARDVFVRDRATGTTVRASVGAGGTQANAMSVACDLSADGRYVVFESDASNLVPGDTNGARDVFVRDLQAGTTERVSVDSSGQALPYAYGASVSADGRYVAFRAGAAYVRDRLTRQTFAVPITQTESRPIVSPDGRYVAVTSWGRVLLYDRTTGRKELVSQSSTGARADASGYAYAISQDGRYVVFVSRASNLAPGYSSGLDQVYLRDRARGRTERVSVKNDGSPFPRSVEPDMSADGRYVTFASWTRAIGQFVVYDVYVRDRALGKTEVVTRTPDGVLADGSSGHPFLSADGRFVEFTSNADNLVATDGDAFDDVFAAERAVATTASFTLSPGAIDFGNTLVGTRSAYRTVKVTNTGTVPLDITWVGVGGLDRAAYERVRRCPDVLPAGASCAVDVAFAPASAGSKQAKLVVSVGIAGAARSTSLSGQAVAP